MSASSTNCITLALSDGYFTVELTDVSKFESVVTPKLLNVLVPMLKERQEIESAKKRKFEKEQIAKKSDDSEQASTKVRKVSTDDVKHQDDDEELSSLSSSDDDESDEDMGEGRAAPAAAAATAAAAKPAPKKTKIHYGDAKLIHTEKIGNDMVPYCKYKELIWVKAKTLYTTSATKKKLQNLNDSTICMVKYIETDSLSKTGGMVKRKVRLMLISEKCLDEFIKIRDNPLYISKYDLSANKNTIKMDLLDSMKEGFATAKTKL
jgi:hypothetical protein